MENAGPSLGGGHVHSYGRRMSADAGRSSIGSSSFNPRLLYPPEPTRPSSTNPRRLSYTNRRPLRSSPLASPGPSQLPVPAAFTEGSSTAGDKGDDDQLLRFSKALFFDQSLPSTSPLSGSNTSPSTHIRPPAIRRTTYSGSSSRKPPPPIPAELSDVPPQSLEVPPVRGRTVSQPTVLTSSSNNSSGGNKLKKPRPASIKSPRTSPPPPQSQQQPLSRSKSVNISRRPFPPAAPAQTRKGATVRSEDNHSHQHPNNHRQSRIPRPQSQFQPKNGFEHWMLANTYSSVPHFSRLSMHKESVVLPISAREFRRAEAKTKTKKKGKKKEEPSLLSESTTYAYTRPSEDSFKMSGSIASRAHCFSDEKSVKKDADATHAHADAEVVVVVEEAKYSPPDRSPCSTTSSSLYLSCESAASQTLRTGTENSTCEGSRSTEGKLGRGAGKGGFVLRFWRKLMKGMRNSKD